MPEPIVFISRNRIVEGKRAAFERAYAQAVELIRATKPQTTLFAAYVDESGTEVSVVHVFADAAAMALHFRGSDERTSSAAEMIVAAGFEVYGHAPTAAVDKLRREAGSAGVRLELHPDPIGGFLRAPVR
jgi:quinol monooxygenase YgiN